MGPNTTTMSYGHHHPQSQQQQVHNLQTVGHSGLDFKPLESSAEASLGRTMSAPVIGPVSSLDAFGDNLSQLSSGWEGELQSVVNMGFLQGRLSTWLPQESHCQMQAGKMKVELWSLQKTKKLGGSFFQLEPLQLWLSSPSSLQSEHIILLETVLHTGQSIGRLPTGNSFFNTQIYKSIADNVETC